MRRCAVGLTMLAVLGVAATSAAARRWRLQRLPIASHQTGAVLAGVSCAAAANCFAVGTYTGFRHVDKNLVAHWDGMSWSLRSTPHPRRAAAFSGVACPTTTVCTAVGGPVVAWADRRSGGVWRRQHLPSVPGPQRWLRAVSCPRSDACMAVGLFGPLTDSRPLAERWTGRRWVRDKVPQPRDGFGGELLAVSCTTPAACVAVGDYDSLVGRGGQKVLAERWNGRRWRVLRTPNPAGDSIELAGVSCRSASWCDAAGSYARSGQGTFFGLIEHWNGRQWTIQRIAGPSGRRHMFELEAISCARRGVCTTVGDSADRSERSHVLAEHLAAGRWSVQRTPDPPGLGGALFGVSCLGSGVCVAVGSQQGEGVFSAPRQIAERYS